MPDPSQDQTRNDPVSAHNDVPDPSSRRSTLTPDEAADAKRLVRASRPAQRLDDLEAAAAVIAHYKAKFDSDPGTPAQLLWRLGEAAVAVVDQLCALAEIGYGPERVTQLRQLSSKAKIHGHSVAELLIGMARTVEQRDLGFF